VSASRAPLRIATPIRVGVLALGLVFGYRTVERLLASREGGVSATVWTAAESTSRALADDVERAEAQRQQIAMLLETRGMGTYLDELLEAHDGWNYRWRDRRGEPMRIWVQEPRANPASDAGWVLRVRESFSVWDGLGLPLTFTFIRDSARAEVHVTWVDRFTERMTGRTQWRNDADGWIVGASIELALHLPDGRRVTSDGVQAIARHEVGHLIGLDHTRDTTSIMAAQVFVTELSDSDRRTARLVYDLPAGRLREPRTP
jgi:hypothetical protein